MIVSYDISTKDWTVTEEDSPEFLYFGFSDQGAEKVIFDNLSFGVIVSSNEEVLLKESMPPEGTTYISTTEPYVHWYEVSRKYAGDQYEYFVWVENGGERVENFFTIVYYPTKPFPSWTWSDVDRNWIAPVPYPQDGQDYYWNEDRLSWDSVDANII